MNKSKRLANDRGQVIIEYVLLMIIAVGLAVALTRQLVSRNQDDPGVLTGAWHNILTTIGDDIPDKQQ
ncbi:MAG: hypothetical protein ACLGGX_10255 [Bdellovibrionia bacterium]